MTDEENREERLRRRLGQHGWKLQKSAERDPHARDFSYFIVDVNFNVVGHGHPMDLDQVEAWLEEEEKDGGDAPWSRSVEPQ